MKDLPHHMKKLNRRVLRSILREELETENYEPEIPSPPQKQTERQIKKQAKAKGRKEKESRVPTPLTPEERQKKMKHRVPVFDRTNNAKPKVSKPTKKKTPRI